MLKGGGEDSSLDGREGGGSFVGDGDPMCTCNLQGQVQRGTPGGASRLSCSGGQFALTCSPQSGCCSQPVKGVVSDRDWAGAP